MKTNKDLYNEVMKLNKIEKENNINLENYLNNMLRNIIKLAKYDSLSLDQFFELLKSSYKDNESIDIEKIKKFKNDKLNKCIETIIHQIKDLRDMKDNGQLDDNQKWGGITAPSGREWYNFDPNGYLECALAGTVGGWDDYEGDTRIDVDGPVTYIDENEEFVTVHSNDIDNEVFEISNITWDLVESFLYCGQVYE